MEALKNTIHKPWLCVGDFNEILWYAEKRGGHMRTNANMVLFRDTLHSCNLIDLGFEGPPFTWSNGRQGGELIRERLDRAVATPDWRNRFPKCLIRHLQRYKSDHSPLLMNFEEMMIDNTITTPRDFRMEHMWLHHPKFKEIMTTTWNGTYLEENITAKIQKCGSELMQWAKREFGSVRKKKTELYERLQELQQERPSPIIEHEMRKVEMELDAVLQNEETMWFQRSRALWLQDGDKNTKFFHQKASNRRKRNTIQSIENERGVNVTKFEEIVEVIRNYFIHIFSHEESGNVDAVLNAVECKVTLEMNEALTKDYTAEEIVHAIKQMHPTKAPGLLFSFKNSGLCVKMMYFRIC